MNARSMSSALLIVTQLLMGNIAFAQDESQELLVEKVFGYGETCAQLAQLTRVELNGITHPSYGEQFFDFCKPDTVYRCEDYNALLAGLGSLEDNGQSSCRYLPR